MLLYNDYSELLKPLDLPHVSRHMDHPIEIICPMKRLGPNELSHAEFA
jgi:hypothetical protein